MLARYEPPGTSRIVRSRTVVIQTATKLLMLLATSGLIAYGCWWAREAFFGWQDSADEKTLDASRHPPFVMSALAAIACFGAVVRIAFYLQR